MARILITGGLGFIGGHLCERLAQEGHYVVAYDNTITPAASAHFQALTATFPDRYRYIPGTIRDPDNLRACFLRFRPEVVIHLAALAGVRASTDYPEICLETNVLGTTHVLEACKEAGVSRILFASSSSVYGHPDTPGEPSHEYATAEYPLSPYAASKRAGELLCHTYAHLYGMKILCLRLFSVYGPRQRSDLAFPIFARQMLAGKPLTIFGDGASQRDYTYVDDVVDGFMRGLAYLSTMPIHYDMINLGSGTPYRLADTIMLLQMALHVQDVSLDYHPSVKADVDITWAEISRARLLLEWEPRIGLPEGIQRFADWYLAQR